MSLTLVHALLPYCIVSLFTKDRKLRLLALVAGAFPDLDGLPIFWDRQLFLDVHREILHMPILGLVFSIPLAFVLEKYYKIAKWKTITVFTGAFVLHSITDVFFTDWPIKLLWPLSMENFSFVLPGVDFLNLVLLGIVGVVTFWVFISNVGFPREDDVHG